MHLYQEGMPLAVLTEFLGHEDHETTLIYAYADTETKRKVIEKASEKGLDYKDFPDIYVIFISKFDIFQEGKTIYPAGIFLQETGC